jgi:hypothetical protein
LPTFALLPEHEERLKKINEKGHPAMFISPSRTLCNKKGKTGPATFVHLPCFYPTEKSETGHASVK